MLPSSALAPGSANLICVGFTLIYVAGFYIFETPGHRNDPQVIKARIKAVTVASVVSAIIVWYNLQAKESIVPVLGILLSIDTTYRTLLLTCLLFLGPLTVMFFDQELPFQNHFDFERDVKWMFTTLEGIRNYIMAPLTEEFVFRSCMIAILNQANYSTKHLIFVSPLYFGIAHLHHAWDNYNRMGRTPQALQNVVLTSLFQFIYTTLFGWYASYLFMRTGSLWPSVLNHSFCNMMGFPSFDHSQHRSFIQKTIIYASFPLGVLLFIYNIDSLTSTSKSMYWT